MFYSRTISAFALALALLLAPGCGTTKKPDSYNLQNIGVGPADTWHTLPLDYVDEAARRGYKFIVTEHIPTVQEHEGRDWRKGNVLLSYPALAHLWNQQICKNGQVHIVFLVNWNVKPLRSLPDSWFAGILREANEVYDPACTWLEPLVEPDEGDLAKRQRWMQMAVDSWPGVVIASAAGAGWPMRRNFVDRHPGSVADAERLLRSDEGNLIVITDGGPFVHPPTVFGELPGLFELAKAEGKTLVLYTDRYAPFDLELHREVLRRSLGIGAPVP
jgi:hypothetical protein